MDLPIFPPFSPRDSKPSHFFTESGESVSLIFSQITRNHNEAASVPGRTQRFICFLTDHCAVPMIPGFADQRAGNFNDDFKFPVDFKKIFSVSKKIPAISFFRRDAFEILKIYKNYLLTP